MSSAADRPPHSPMPPILLVILSEAKNPRIRFCRCRCLFSFGLSKGIVILSGAGRALRERRSRRTCGCFCRCPLSSPNRKNRHFDRSCSGSHHEQRSGQASAFSHASYSACHSERSEEPPHFAFAVAVVCFRSDSLKDCHPERSRSRSSRTAQSKDLRLFLPLSALFAQPHENRHFERSGEICFSTQISPGHRAISICLGIQRSVRTSSENWGVSPGYSLQSGDAVDCSTPRPNREATHSIAFAIAIVFLSPFSAQKSHVKPRNHLTPYHPTTSEWHFSYVPNAILDI
jgi:hypothetical protein